MKTYPMQRLLSLNIKHDYFGGKRSSCIDIIPGRALVKLINRFDLVIRQTLNGIELYGEINTSIGAWLSYITKATALDCFNFNLVPIDDAFFYFTDLPKENVQLLYDSSSTHNKNGVNIVELVAGNILKKQPADFAKVLIRFSDICNVATPNFNITFQAKSTQWQYYVVENGQSNLKNPEITGKSMVKFDGPATVKLPSGDTALLFTSGDNLLPLSFTPVYKFNLVDYYLQSEGMPVRPPNVVYNGLPVPDPLRNLISTKGDASITLSPMYIYI